MQIKIYQLDGEGEPQPVAVVRLQEGRASTDNGALQEKWEAQGILGRPEQGRVYPRDGQRFLDELPYMYRASYLWAERQE